ncbi:MAG TPA: peptide ABC transporter substrate-binding protein [Opitutaceae bacterium]|nr:peptide ABC transporter substrate-binding protein [Opitutaceae bacterium]
MLNRPPFLVLAALAVLAGCKKSENTGSPAAGQTPGAQAQVLHLGNGTEPQDLDPQIVTGVPENKIVNALFEGLVAYGPNGQGTVPAAAARWTISPDGLVYTFYLQPEGRWSNGDPVTAQHFVRSYQRLLTPSLAAEYANKLFPVVGAEEFYRGQLSDFSQTGFKAIDPSTLQITLKRRTSFLLESMKHYAWFPVHIPTVEKFGGLDRKGTAWTRVGNLVGNGPFILKEWSMQQRLVADKSPTYWDRAAVKLNQIVFYPTENIETEERMFRTGQLHKTNEMPLDKTDVYRREQPESLRIDPLLGIYFYRINTTRPPLNDKRVRKALALAINREQLVEKVTRQNQIPAYGACPPMEAFTSPARLSGDLDEARRLLAEAGYPGGKGLRKIDLLYNTSQNHKKIAEAIQQMWRVNLGVEVGLMNQEWKVYLDSQDTLNYDLCRAGWIADYVDPNTFFDLWRTGDGNNDTGFANPEYDRMLEQALNAPTQADRMAIYAKMDALLMDEVPIIPIYFYTRTYAMNPKVNYPVNLVETPNWKFIYLKE